jgi:selenium-binding protein 1
MASWSPDPKLFSATGSHRAIVAARDARSEELAYVSLSAANDGQCDGIGVVDTTSGSPTLGRLIGRVDFPGGSNEVRHFGWSGCRPDASRAGAAHHRYLIAPGTRSSRIHVVDTMPDPRAPRLVRVIEAEEIARNTGYCAPHTVHCGPDAVYVSALGAPGGGGPGGIFTLDPETFAVQGPWEQDRGPQMLASDFHWHSRHGAMITSEWATPNQLANGVSGDMLTGGGYGHALHVWDLATRRHEQTIDLGARHQMVLTLCPAHNPARAYGFASVVSSADDLSASVFLWYLGREADGSRGAWNARKVIRIAPRPTDAARLPPVLRERGVVPPLVTNISLSADDRWLYVSCWGTGELRRYDVSDPFNPDLTGLVHLGGIVRRAPHPGSSGMPRNGGPQMTAVSRDGRSVYVTNGFYTPWDDRFYPDGVRVDGESGCAGGWRIGDRPGVSGRLRRGRSAAPSEPARPCRPERQLLRHPERQRGI